MPCYTEWDAYLQPGTPEYDAMRAELEAKLQAVRHAVDYYYGTRGTAVPHATHSGVPTHLEFVETEFHVHSLVPDEEAILDQLSHHLACDEVHFTAIYDLVSLLNIREPSDAGYARVLIICANRLRAAL